MKSFLLVSCHLLVTLVLWPHIVQAQETFQLSKYLTYGAVYVADSTGNWATPLHGLSPLNSTDGNIGWTDYYGGSWSTFANWNTTATCGGVNEAYEIDAATSDYNIATVADFTVSGLKTVQGFFGLGDGRSTSFANVRFVIQVESGDVQYFTVLDSTITAYDTPGWRSFNIDLSAYSSGRIKVRFITDPNGVSWEDWSKWADVNLIADSIISAPYGTTHTVTFKADLSSLLGAGFNPTTDSIGIRGGWPPFSWQSDIPLVRDTVDTNVFKCILPITMPVGTTLEYRFHAWPESFFIAFGWDTVTNNRTLVFADHDTVLSAVSPEIYLVEGTQPPLAQIPTIASFGPTSGPVGTSVTITGSNFNPTAGNNIVCFGAVKTSITVATDTRLTVTVPAGATFQPITVTDTTTGLTAYSNQPFIVTFAGSTAIDTTSFLAAAHLATGRGPAKVAIVDLDGDSKPDIVVTDTIGSISVFRNTSANNIISFAPKVDSVAGNWTDCITTGDFDGDGKPDIAVTNGGDDTVSVFPNTSTPGNISFAPKIDLAAGSGPVGIATSDLDGDGKPDIVVMNNGSNTFSVFHNTSTNDSISFAAKIDFPTSGGIIAIGDLDGDGKPDIAVSTWNEVRVFRNTSAIGSISFAPGIDFEPGTNSWQVAIADLDGDGKPDILSANSNETLSVLQNTSTVGNMSFTPGADLSTGTDTEPYDLAVGDLNGDGKPDAVVTSHNGNTFIVFGNTSVGGSISFVAAVNFKIGGTPWGIAIGDLDGDGTPDIVATNSSSDTVLVFQSIIGQAPLDVEATQFTATVSNGSVVVSWQTQSEINNLGFNIYRKELESGTSEMIASYNSNRNLRGLGASSAGRGYSFIDRDVVSSRTYQYTVESVASNGMKKVYPSIQVKAGVPTNYALYQNFPNPFNPSTQIQFDIPHSTHVKLVIFDILGQQVATLVDEVKDAGTYSAMFDGSRLTSGVYFFRIRAGHYVATKKLVLMK